MQRDSLLTAVSSTEGSTFNELCSALRGDCPEKGDRDGWREMFQELRDMEKEGLVEVTRDAHNQIEQLILTDAGAAAAREALDRRRRVLDSRRPLLI